MNSIPQLRNMTAPFSTMENISSQRLNEKFEIAHDNWSRLLLAAQSLATDVRSMETAFGVFNAARNAGLGALISRIDYLQSNLPYRAFVVSAYDAATTVVSSTNIRADLQFGMITLSRVENRFRSKISRFLSSETGRVEVSVLNKIYYGPNAENLVLQTSDSPLYRAIDGNDDTFWIENISEGGTITRLIRIETPTSGFPYANVVEIQPFPDIACEVKAARFKRPDGSYTEGALPMRAGRGYSNALCLLPSPIEYGDGFEIEITTQGAYLGLSQLDVGFVEYPESGQIVWNMHDENGISELNRIFVDAQIPTSVGMYTLPYTLEIADDDEFTNILYNSDSDGIPYNTPAIPVDDATDLYIRLTLRRVNETTPIIRGLGIAYTGTV